MDRPSSRRGLEVGAQWPLGDSLSIGITYTYTHSQDADSATELRRPRHAGSVQADYAFAGGRAHIAFAADYGGTRQDVFFPPFPNPSEIVTLGNYWLVDLAAHLHQAVGQGLGRVLGPGAARQAGQQGRDSRFSHGMVHLGFRGMFLAGLPAKRAIAFGGIPTARSVEPVCDIAVTGIARVV